MQTLGFWTGCARVREAAAGVVAERGARRGLRARWALADTVCITIRQVGSPRMESIVEQAGLTVGGRSFAWFTSESDHVHGSVLRRADNVIAIGPDGMNRD